MIRRVDIDLNTYALYDVMLNCFYSRKYPEEIKSNLKILYNSILKFLNDKETYNGLDMTDKKIFYHEVDINGKDNTIELDIDCFLLDDFLTSYIDNKSNSFPQSIIDKIEELKKEIQKYLPDENCYLEEDIISVDFIEEIEYEEPLI